MTYLSMVRADPSQISQILESTFNQCEKNESASITGDKNVLQLQFSQYFDQCKQFMFGQINHQLAVNELLKNSESGKGVCAKTLSYGDVAWKCETCEKDPTCIICQDCFEKGDHKGHKIWLKRNVSGCCDCGDPDAWAEEGFCTKHKGYVASIDTLLEQLPPFIKKSTQYVFRHVALQMKIQSLKLQLAVANSKGKGYKGVVNKEIKKELEQRGSIIALLFEFMDWSVEVSPAFIHFWTDELNESFISEIKNEASIKPMLKNQYDSDPQSESIQEHRCCPRSYINQEDRNKFALQLQQMILEEDGKDSILLNQQTSGDICIFTEDTLRELRLLKGVCTCRVLDLTMQVNHLVNIKSRNIQYELYFKMFQSFKFKQILGLSFGANFDVLSLEKNEKAKDDRDIGSIGVQILTIDEISLMVVQDDNIRNLMLETLTKAIDILINTEFNEPSQATLYRILYDFKYMTRHQTLTHLISKTDFIEKLLEQVAKLYYHDLQEHRTEHILFDAQTFKEGLYNIDLFIFKVLKSFLKAVDFSDIERNKRIMATFIDLFTEIRGEMPDRNVGFFAIPLHRIFSYYLNRLLMQNYIVKTKKDNSKSLKDSMLHMFKVYIDIPHGQNAWKYIQSLIEVIVAPLARKWVFCHEVISGKWVMSGLHTSHLAKLIYKVFENYLLMHLGLFQLLIAVSPEPQKTIDLISSTFNTGSWMTVLVSKMHSGGLSCTIQQLEKDFEKFKPLYDQKKIRQIINWQLNLYIQLAVTETPILYPLLTNLSKKESLTFPVQNDCNAQIEQFYKNDMRRAIVHSMILLGGRCDIKQLKQQMEGIDLYMESEFFEDELLKVTTQVHTESKGGSKIQFKLNEEQYLNWFDPYYYLIPESLSKVQEVIQSVYQEKKMLNEVLGDYIGNYKYSSPIPSLVAESLAGSSQLLTFMSSLIVQWANQLQTQSNFKLVDEQMGHSLLKLLHILIKSCKTQPSLPLIKALTDNEMVLIMSLKVKSQQHVGTSIERASKELLKEIYELDQVKFAIVGEMMGFVIVQGQDSSQEVSEFEEIKTQRELSGEQEAQRKKEAAKKRQEAILKKFQTQREQFNEKIQQPNINNDQSMISSRSGLSRSNSVMDDEEEENLDEIECSLCKEILVVEDHSYLQNPFGQFAYVSTSKLLYHSYRQALEPYFGQSKEDTHEEEKKESEINEPTPLNPFEKLPKVNCLEQKQGTGGVLIKCSHYAHKKCLSSFLTAQEADQRKRELKRIIGLDFETFQCPLCKHIANVLLPFNTLNKYHDLTAIFDNFNKYELLQFQCDVLSKIVKSQEMRKKDLLPVDIRNNPQEFLQSIQKFVEHKIQLLDVKGLDEFFRKHHKHTDQRVHVHNRVGKEQYADIIETSRSALNLILDGSISVGQASQDVQMNDQSIESICLGEIKRIYESVKGWQLMELDFSSLAIQLMFFTIILYGCGNYQQLDKVNLELTRSLYQMFNLQSYLKAQFSINSLLQESLRGKPAEILAQISNRSKLLNTISKDSQFQEQFIIPSQLSFLRKLAALKVLTHTIHWRNQRFSQADMGVLFSQENYFDLKKRDDEFILQISRMVDDKVEFKLLSKYLGIEDLTSAEASVNSESQEKDLMHGSFIEKEESKSETILPDEIMEIVSYFKSEENQQRALETYALSKVVQLLNPQLVIDEKETPIIKEQILQSEKLIKMEMPAQFRLLQPNLIFKLVQLPNDFQSLVQTYYKRKCRNCNTQPKEHCVCLLCGETLCFLQKCCTGSLPKMKPNEGELSFHSRMCEGSSSMYICTTKGQIILIEEDRSCQKPSPYVNKFGETFSNHSKKWENYHLQIQQQPGVKGINLYDELRKTYMNFSLANEIIKDRSSSEVVWRLRAV